MGGLIDAIGSEGKVLAKMVAEGAPIIASLLGTPIAGVAMSLLANAFGADAGNASDILEKIKSDPELMIKLKTLEYNHAENLHKFASDDYAMEVSDREDARKNAVLYKDFLRHMAYLITFGFFGALALLFTPITFDPNERQLLSMLVGMLVSKWQTIIDFFYGSSRKQGGST